jgi:2-aminoadipate transaminase
MADAQPFKFEGLFAKDVPQGRPPGFAKRGKYDFAVAYPDPKSLPLQGLVDSLQKALEEDGEDLAIYSDPQGYAPLREFVANKLKTERNIPVGPDGILLGDGSGQPIHNVCEALIDPGDVVLTEDYVYSGTLNQLRRFRADVRGVQCDGDGMLPDSLEREITKATGEGKRVKFVYTIPTYQNPQGWTMTLERRKAMVQICNKHGAAILEDDCYVDLRLDGDAVPTSIYSLDESGSTMYVASFSKIIGPGMRLGYLAAPEAILSKARLVKSGGSVNSFAAFAVDRYSRGHLDEHIDEINNVQRGKRDAMVAALGENFGGAASWSQPHGGLFIWLKMQEGADLQSIRDKVLEEFSVGYHPGPNFAPDGVSGKNYARLCFGYNQPEEIHEGIAQLARAFEKFGVLNS